MEKNQEETIRKLDDVQSMLLKFLVSFIESNHAEDKHVGSKEERMPGKTSGNVPRQECGVEEDSAIPESSEKWWDRMCGTSDEGGDIDRRKEKSMPTNMSSEKKKCNLHRSSGTRKEKHSVALALNLALVLMTRRALPLLLPFLLSSLIYF
ncbi:hypothetical protein KC19_VG189300 [Ceratodon purpureus]|uniref:Uncharacterized protein n=1 Tax=Ceratodon purpureus TaxID=3225 RepID=A0A8T0HS30_CERPU|nr:hypothetical protein KC19_VG189300 [Ceratodon purpureus]